VDIPRCDSIFIGKVSDTSSEIRAVQRTCRGCRLDEKNKDKVNRVFIWSLDERNVINMLELLKRNDPEFHRKVKKENVEYDNSEQKERKDMDEKETIKIREFVNIKCLSSKEIWMMKFKKVREFTANNKKLPSHHSKNEDENKLGRWEQSQRTNYKERTKAMTDENVRKIWNDFMNENPTLFANDEDVWNETFKDVNMFKEKKGYLPKNNSKDKKEKQLAQWIQHQNINLKKKIKSMTTEHEERRQIWDDFLKRTGYRYNTHKIWETVFEELNRFRDKKRRLPRNNCEDEEEKRIYQWFFRQNTNYRKKKGSMSLTYEKRRQAWENFRNDNGLRPLI
jgi:hypothetical protein